jgi:hypothetical protein
MRLKNIRERPLWSQVYEDSEIRIWRFYRRIVFRSLQCGVIEAKLQLGAIRNIQRH